MISIEKEKLIRKLLRTGLTAVEITRRTGVNRKLIGQIKKLSEIRKRKTFRRHVEKDIPYELKEAKRCEKCGGKVFVWPCLICNPKGGCY